MPNNPGTPEARRLLDTAPWAYFIGRSTPDGPEKFWRIRSSMNYLETWWGRVGTTGQRNVKIYPDVGSATSAYAALRASKLSRGYRQEEEMPALSPTNREWAARYRNHFVAGTASRVISGVLSVCTNRTQERLVEARARDLVAQGGGRVFVTSEQGGWLGELVVSRAPGDGFLDFEREREQERQAVVHNSWTLLPVRPAARVDILAPTVPLRDQVETEAHRTEAPRRRTNIQVAREASAPFRPQVDPLTHRVAVYALRDVRNGGAVIHPRGFKQMLRSADAAEVVTGSLDYGYQHPDQVVETMPEVERLLRERPPLSAAEAIRATVRAAQEIEELAHRERQRAAASSPIFPRDDWQSHLVGHSGDGAVLRLFYREIQPDDGRIYGIPWLTLHLWGEPETPLRLRLCGRFLGIWEVSFSGPKAREYKEALSRPLSAEGAAALAFHGMLSEAFERGYLPEAAAKAQNEPARERQAGTGKIASANPQGTVALARFAGIDLDEEEI